MIFNPVFAYIAGGALLVGLASGWVVRDWKADADLLKEKDRTEQVRAAMQANNDALSSEYEDLRANLEPGKVETRNTIREIYRNVQVPTECAASDDVVGVLGNVRLRASALASGESGEVLSPTAADTPPVD